MTGTPETASLVTRVLRRALQRDVVAEQRDARARRLAEEVAAQPSAYEPATLLERAALDRAAAAADRDSAAEDREALARLIPGGWRGSHGLDLTSREVEVLERISRGMTNQEIADDLYLAKDTVKSHTQNLYNKIKVRNRTEASRWARDHGYG